MDRAQEMPGSARARAVRVTRAACDRGHTLRLYAHTAHLFGKSITAAGRDRGKADFFAESRRFACDTPSGPGLSAKSPARVRFFRGKPHSIRARRPRCLRSAEEDGGNGWTTTRLVYRGAAIWSRPHRREWFSRN